MRSELITLFGRPGPRSVLIIDNASCHRSQELKEIRNKARVVLEFLSPYSLDFNSIEESFSALKAQIRRNRKLADVFTVFGDFLALSVDEFMRRKNAHGYFWSARVGIPLADNAANQRLGVNLGF